MTEGKQCFKCGHTNTDPQLEACPQCGAYYAKVEARIASNHSQPRDKPKKKSPLLPRVIKGLKAAKESPRLARIEERKGKDTLPESVN
jgi:predicted  nucleic acid-binding Zn-ribbon protein